jgi:peptidoglycan/xylan/chitin deacetylase (PgdA/CDA1 family)
MIASAQKLIRTMDAAVARVYLGLRPERDALLCFLFHSLFRDEQEIDRNLVDPLQWTTVTMLRQFIEYFRAHGYRFVGPQDLLNGLEDGEKYALITFDDGYYNNTLALPVLEELSAPAIFFISTQNVVQNKCFWWDVVYRERAAQGVPRQRRQREINSFKLLRTEQIEDRLRDLFGPDCFTPRCDIDRPFSSAEVGELARNPWAHIGNHTANHAILTNYTPSEVRKQLLDAQDDLRKMTGKTPVAVAYPNGAYSEQIVRICQELGLSLGFTIQPHKVGLPFNGNASDRLRLGRFVPDGQNAVTTECRTFRSDLLTYGHFRDGYLRLMRGPQPS